MFYDIIIIGGGISSLYFSNKYLEKYPRHKLLIIEKKNRLGGRIDTETTDLGDEEFTYELGAGRFNNSHQNVTQLIDTFHLNDKIIENSNNIDYFFNETFHYKNNFLERSCRLLKEAFRLSKIPKSKLYLHNTIDILRNHLSEKEVDFILNTIPYRGQFYLMNAYDFYNYLISDYFKNKQYYSLKGGLSQLVDKLDDIIIQKGGIIHISEKCIEINKNKELFKVNTDKAIYNTNSIIVAVPPEASKKIKGIPQNNKIIEVDNKIIGKPLYRIYAIYPKQDGKVWFRNINRIISDTPIRNIIPINKDIGLIMISYTDYTFANKMNQYNLDGKVLDAIQSSLENIFPDKDIPKPTFYTGYYWKNGVHYWKPNYSSKRDFIKSIQPIKNYKFYLMGESYSPRQGWIEGSLISANKVLDKISGESKYISRNEKKITMKELSKHTSIDDAWIALNGNVYDVTSWIPNHPGGMKIMRGVGKDYTRNFSKVSSHQMNKSRIKGILDKIKIGKLV